MNSIDELVRVYRQMNPAYIHDGRDDTFIEWLIKKNRRLMHTIISKDQAILLLTGQAEHDKKERGLIMSDFNTALESVLENEGGYANDPHDPGRETYCGISRRFWPNWEGWKLLDHYQKINLPLHVNETICYGTLEADVAEFYLNHFWTPLKCGEIANSSVAESLFDFGINVGRKRAVRVLQETVNIYSGARGRIKVDGLIGAKTLAGVERACIKSVKFPNGFIRSRIEFYLDLCYGSRQKNRYLKGWIMRSLKSLEK